MKRVKRIPEAGNGGEVSLFLLQGIVKRAWPQEQPHARLRDMVSSRTGHKQGPSHSTNASHHFRTQLKAIGPIDAATGGHTEQGSCAYGTVQTNLWGVLPELRNYDWYSVPLCVRAHTVISVVTGQVHHPAWILCAC